MTNDTLAACPFCGKLHTLKISLASEVFGVEDEPYMHSEAYAVTCDASRPDGSGGCGASGGYKPTEAEAIEAWEARALTAQALTEALALSEAALSHAINQAACDIASDRTPDDRIRAIGRALWRQWQAQQSAQATAGMSNDAVDALLHELDEIARDHDSYDYGLPMHEITVRQKMRDEVRSTLSALPRPQPQSAQAKGDA